jgi:hypothetical protein
MTRLQDRWNLCIIHTSAKDAINSLPVEFVEYDKKMRAVDSDLASFVFIHVRRKLLGAQKLGDVFIP